jgi:hypothetical protein
MDQRRSSGATTPRLRQPERRTSLGSTGHVNRVRDRLAQPKLRFGTPTVGQPQKISTTPKRFLRSPMVALPLPKTILRPYNNQFRRFHDLVAGNQDRDVPTLRHSVGKHDFHIDNTVRMLTLTPGLLQQQIHDSSAEPAKKEGVGTVRR